MIDFTGIDLPFSPGELLSSGVGLLGVISGFLLLAMAFLVVPYLINMIVGSFVNKPQMSGDHSEYDSNGKQTRDKYGNRIRS